MTKINSKKLASALKLVTPVTSARASTLPVLSNIKLHATLGVLHLYATNLDAYATATCECEGDLEAVCVKATSLQALIQNATGDVEIEATANSRLKVKASGVGLLGTADPKDFPEWPSNIPLVGLNTQELGDCISRVEWAADPGSQDGRIQVRCIGVWTTARGIVCAATNGRRVGYVDRPSICAPSTFMLPAAQAKLFCEVLADEDCNLGVSDKFAMASTDGMTAYVRLSEGNYFDVTKVWSNDRTQIGALEIAPLIAAVEQIKMLSEPWNDGVDLHFSDAGLEVVYASQINDFNTRLDGRYNEHKVRFGAANLLEGLQSLQGPSVDVTAALNVVEMAEGDYKCVLSKRILK
jgi:DNA polymerase III sliding clamp (beta) subunit (PCNA family)